MENQIVSSGLASSFFGYKNLVDSINDVVFQTDTEGNWSFLNNSWCRIMEYEVDEVLGKPFFNYLHPDDVVKNYMLFKPLIEGHKSYCSHEIRYIKKSGKAIWLKVFAILLKDEVGNVLGTSGTLQDITSDKQNRDMIELLSNNVTDLICLHEIDGTFIYVSPSAASITGYSDKELIGKSPYDFYYPEDIDILKKAHENAMIQKHVQPNYVTLRLKNKSGNYTWVEKSVKSIRDEDGNFIGLVTSTRPIDIRKKAEEQILMSLQREKELSQMKSNFVGLASHQIRTPLSSIRSSAELLAMKAIKNSEHKELISKYTNNIWSEVDRLSLLIDEVLTVSKIESHAFECKKREININHLLRKVTTEIENSQSDNRKVQLKLSRKKEIVMADPLFLEHALGNLISNAIKYSPGKASPKVELNFSANKYEIKVRDFGLGIPYESQSKIFHAFHRAENVSNIKGTGLGMFIAKYLIELHGGSIGFVSKPNEGTIFTVTLSRS